MEVHVNLDSSLIPINPGSVQALANDFISFHNLSFDEVSICFVDTKTICTLHDQFFDDPSTTDCISFPMDDAEDEGYKVMGEIFVCPETAVNYIQQQKGDLYEEVTLYVVHGLLHLIGFDDIEDTDREKMRAEEVRYLKHVDTENLWILS
ncbi:MAG: rRNA maturation RNase YbeY [Parachlamydiaceae bacterium]